MAYPNDQQGKALPFFARFLSVSKEESSIKSQQGLQPKKLHVEILRSAVK